MQTIKQLAARILVTIAAPVVVAACGQQSQSSAPVAAASDAAPAPSAFTHLIITVPEGVQMPANPVDTAAKEQSTGPATPWVRSLKRDAPSGFSTLSSLGFPDAAAAADWSKTHASQLTVPFDVKHARVLTSSDAPATRAAQAVFKISYYSLVAPLGEFEAWVNGYLGKYLKAQRDAGILASYVMYLEEGDQGRALLVLEYPDAATEQSAEPIKEKLSEQLAANDEEYAAQMVKKEELRTTQSWTLAVPVAVDGG